MNTAEKMERVTLEEFEAMKREEGFNYELIDGVVMMSPTPNFQHQRISNKLVFRLNLILQTTDCQPLYEYNIRCENTVLEPDVMVFCGGNEEIPEIVFEILSPSTKQKDILVKPAHYQAMGIKEYWIIDPKVKAVTVHDFVNQTTETYGIEDTIQSKAILEIIIAVADIFA